MALFMEKAIIEKIAQRRLDEGNDGQGGDGMDEAGKAAAKKKPMKKSMGALKKMRKMAKKREVKATDPRRAASMRKVWSSKRSAMMKGWKNRKKLYGPSGRRAGEAAETIQGLLASVVENQGMDDDTYEQLQQEAMNYLYAIMADQDSEPGDVYEELVNVIAPIVTIVESIAEAEGVIDEDDQTNIEALCSQLDEAGNDNQE